MQYFTYILCRVNEDRSSNPKDYEGNNCTFWMRQQKSAYFTKYLSNYLIDLRQTFSVSSHIYGDYTKIDCLHSLLWRSTTDWPIIKRL